MRDVGDKLPALTLARDGGGSVDLGNLGGKWLVLYFYPKDDTPGCTKESIGFTEALGAYEALNAQIMGVSRDSAASHEKFICKYDLKFPLLSDEDGALCEAFGVWVEKTLFGKKGMGIERSTYIASPDGTIKAAWRKVNVDGHVEEVLAKLKELQAA